MKSILMAVLVCGVLAGCNGYQSARPIAAIIPAAPTTPVHNQPPWVDPTAAEIESVIAQTNEQRTAQGQEPLVPGLSCTLYTVPNTTTSIVSASLNRIGSWSYYGQFNVPNGPVTAALNILPSALQPVYQTWYVVKCTGVLVNLDNNWHEFGLSSDDGSNLYIDGLLINNDGLHSVATISGAKFLTYGTHSFELDFFQGGGYQALILAEDGQLMPSEGLYH